MDNGGFTSKIGFVLSAAGAAVGLGNLWRFPYLAARYGGSFLLAYLLLAATFGFTLLAAEVCLGRLSGGGPIVSYRLCGRHTGVLSKATLLVPAVVLPYYCIVGGWVLKYFILFVLGGGEEAAEKEFFHGFLLQVTEPTFLFVIFLLLCVGITMLGIQNGIEQANKIFMPLLIVLMICIAAFVVAQPDVRQGLHYYLVPKASGWSAQMIFDALCQLFYSLSIGMGIMITFGSYLPKKTGIEIPVLQILCCDTLVAFLAGLMIVPVVSSMEQGSVSEAGPELMFVTMPRVFLNMPMGRPLGVVFFLLVFLAALTSAVSFTETLVTGLKELCGQNRPRALTIVFVLTLFVGVLCAVSYRHLLYGYALTDWLDAAANQILIPLCALGTCMLLRKPQVMQRLIQEMGSPFRFKRLFYLVLRHLAPIGILCILLWSWLH